jgi:mannosylglycerate hydrolase
LEEGPVRAALEVSFTARVPRGLVEDRSRRTSELVEMPLRFRLSVCMGSDKVEVDGELVNHAFDHRLRARFSAGIRATHILSDGQFSVERRPLSKPDTTGWAQRITEIRPHQSWVSIADSDTAICVHTDGLHEHEGLGDDEGRPIGEESAGADTSSLAVTLLRSFGWLSRGDLDTRKGQAGPMIATPDAQQIGRNRFRFSFRMLAGERFLKRSDCASRPTFLECLTAPTGNGQRGLDHQFSFVRFEGDELSLTAMKASVRVPGAVLIRFFNTSHEAVSRPVGISRLFDRATRVRLDETPLEEEDLQEGVMLIRAKPAEIITIRLEPAPRHRVERAWGAFRRQAEPRETKGPGAEV